MAILILAVIIVAAAVIFSYQNSAVVTLSFLAWNFTASLAIIVFLAVLAGIVLMGFVWTITSIKKRRKRLTKTQAVTAGAAKDATLTAKSP